MRRAFLFAIVDAELHEQFLDVERGEELPLTINDDLSGRLARDGIEWLHDFWIWIGDAASLLGVESLIDIGIAEVVLADDLGVLVELLDFGRLLLDTCCAK